MTLVATLAHEVEQTKAQQAVEKFDGDEGCTVTRLVAGQAAAGAAQGARGAISNSIQLRRSASPCIYKVF